MSTRGRRGRGRPAKGSSLSTKSNFLKKPKAYQTAYQGSDNDSRCSTPQSGIYSHRPTRSARQAAQKSRTFMHNIYDNDVDSEYDTTSNQMIPPKDENDSSFSDSSDDSFDDQASVWSETSLSTISSTPGKRKFLPRRPKSPEFIDEKDIPPLTLPPSSTDLFIPSEHLLSVMSIYEVLRHFWKILRLSPCRFEDFCSALVSEESSAMMAEIHISLLKALLRAEDSNNTTFGPSDIKDSINVSLFFLDAMSWFECVRAYIDSDRASEFQAAIPAFSKADYCSTTLSDRIQILQTLTDLFLTTNSVREEIMNEGNIKYDDHCRNCHRLGDLLCCETCSAVYHLTCVEPPMEEVPEEDWVCSVCQAHQVKGVTDCVTDAERHGVMCRQEPLGVDRHQRRYYLICRRIVVDGGSEVWYYSTKPQIEELFEVLDDDKWESDLIRNLLDVRREAEKQMATTEELTRDAKSSKKTAIEMEIANLQKVQTERTERKAKELEEKRQREIEERERREEEERRLEEEEEQREEEARKKEEEARRRLEQGIPEDSIKVEEASEIMETTVVTTTSSELVTMSENMESGLVAKTEEVETTTTTTTVTKTVTSVIKSEDGDVKMEEVGAGDATKVVPEDADKEVKEETAEDGETTSKVNIQSVLPNVRTAVLTPDGRVMTTSGQSLLSSSTKTVMVVGKDGKKTVMRVVNQPSGNSTEPKKEENGTTVVSSSSSTTEESSSSIENRKIVTRSKTGSLTPKQFSDSVSTSTNLKTSLVKNSSEDSLLLINKDGEVSRVTRSKVESTKTGLSVTQHLAYYRLGMEGNFKQYQNQYSTNALALNKHQHNEERDKKRHLSHKFSLTSASEFKWNGSTHGTRNLIVSTLRLTIAQLENNIPTPFLHPNWPIHRQNWVKAVHMCSKPEDFALALTILEASLKPVLLNPVWHEALGHIRMQRMTVLEKEEIKKREKESRKAKPDEEEIDRTVWSKYTLGLKHQVWKQKGEEYRIAGTGGWMWLSSTRAYHLVPQDTVGLRGVAARLRAKKKKADSKNKDKTENQNSEEQMEIDKGVGNEEESDQAKCDDNHEKMAQANTSSEKMDDDDDEDFLRPNDDVIDVTKGLVERTHYVKTTKPYSKLDQLLEKRLRQNDIELKQKHLFEQIVARYRKQEAEKKLQLTEKEKELQKEKEDKEEVMEVDVKEERAKRNAERSRYACYSPSCRCQAESDQLKGYICYSSTCNADDLVSDDEDEEADVDEEIDVTNDDNDDNKEKPDVDRDEEDEDKEDEDMDIDVVGDKKEDSQMSTSSSTGSVGSVKPIVQKPKPVEASSTSRPASTSTSASSLVTAPSSGIISLQSLAKGGKIQLTGQLVSDIEARLALVGNTKLKVSLHKHARLRGKSRLALRKGNLPPGHKFLTKAKKRNLFILEKASAKRLARGAGHREVPGFNYNCKMNNVDWPYPCPRPLFKTSWRYRTQCISNLAAAAVQLRILWAVIRWDDLAAKPPAGGNNTITTETEITTTELLKRRDTGPYGLRSEFLVRKIIVPIGLPQQPREKYTPQRSGLRERKRAETPKQKEPSLSEVWTPEESLELWEIKVFGDKVEKQRAALQEKITQQKQQHQKEASAAKLKAELEDQLKQQRLAMQQKRQDQLKKDDGKTPSTKPQSILQQKFTTVTSKTPQSGIRVITTTLPGSTTPSLVKVTPVRTGSVLTSRAGSTPLNKVTIQPKTLLSAALGGKVQLPTSNVQLRPKTVVTPAQNSTQTTVSSASTPGLKPIAPNTPQSQNKVGTQLQIKPQISGSSSPAAATAAAAAVQNLRIIQGPNGQLQVQGLLPGQQLVRLPDGRLQLITSSATSSALQQKQPATPQKQETKPQLAVQTQAQTQAQVQQTTTAAQPTVTKVQIQPQPQLKPQVAAPSVETEAPTPEPEVQEPAKTAIQAAPETTKTVVQQSASQPQVAITQVAQPQIVVQQGGVVTQQQLVQAQQLIQQQQLARQQQQQQQQLVQQQLVGQPKILPQTVQIKGQSIQIRQQPTLGQLASVGGTVLSTGQQAVIVSSPQPGSAAAVIKSTPIAPKVITSPTQLTSPTQTTAAVTPKPIVAGINAPSLQAGSGVASLLGTPKVVVTTSQATPTTTSPSGVKPVTPVLQQLQQQLQQHRLQLGSNKVVLSSGNKAALTGGHPTLVKLPSGQQFLIRTPITQTAAAAALASLTSSASSASSTTTTTTASTTAAKPVAVALSPSSAAVTAVPLSPPANVPAVVSTPGTASTAVSQSSLLGLASSPPGVGSPDSKYQVTPQVVQQVVKQAMMQTQDPEIQAKLTAMHRQMQQQSNDVTTEAKDKPSHVRPEPAIFRHKNLEVDKKKKVVQEQKTDSARQAVCNAVMRNMLDKIERDEKKEVKETSKKKKQESADEKQEKYRSAKLYGLLYKQKDSLQREMLKKRSNLEKTVQSDVRAEVNDVMRRTKRAIKRKQYKDAWEEDKRIKKQKVISTGNKKRPSAKSNKLYCICKTPYDDSKFYVGCDLCSNWFHGSCVNIDEGDEEFVDSYVCEECRAQQENSSEELYCVCKTPYDETQFYIGCDRCQDWFHGTCVGVSKSEADKMDTYICPKCRQNGTDDSAINAKILTTQNLQDLRLLLKNLQSHKMSWPFRTAVDRRQVPDYYKVIKEPMDLSMVSKRLENGQYRRLGDFVKDVMKIFDNCRYYNATDSPFYQCAEILEPHFVQNLKTLKENM